MLQTKKMQKEAGDTLIPAFCIRKLDERLPVYRNFLVFQMHKIAESLTPLFSITL